MYGKKVYKGGTNGTSQLITPIKVSFVSSRFTTAELTGGAQALRRLDG